MSNEAIEAAKARAAELKAAKEAETAASGVVAEAADQQPIAPTAISGKGKDLTHVDLDSLDPNAPVPAAVVDLSQAQPLAPLVTPNFAGQLTAGAPIIQQATQTVGGDPAPTAFAAAVAMEDSAVEAARNFKTFKHMYAGANVIMPDGTKLRFGGTPGQNGFYTTDVPDEIAYLKAMCRTASSQVAEEKNLMSPELAALRAQAAEDARRNTLLETDPAIVTARNNLQHVIAANGG